MGPVAPRHVESSWTGDRTYVPCIGRQVPIHFSTREVLPPPPNLSGSSFPSCALAPVQPCPVSCPSCWITSLSSAPFWPPELGGGSRGGAFWHLDQMLSLPSSTLSSHHPQERVSCGPRGSTSHLSSHSTVDHKVLLPIFLELPASHCLYLGVPLPA